VVGRRGWVEEGRVSMYKAVDGGTELGGRKKRTSCLLGSRSALRLFREGKNLRRNQRMGARGGWCTVPGLRRSFYLLHKWGKRVREKRPCPTSSKQT